MINTCQLVSRQPVVIPFGKSPPSSSPAVTPRDLFVFVEGVSIRLSPSMSRLAAPVGTSGSETGLAAVRLRVESRWCDEKQWGLKLVYTIHVCPSFPPPPALWLEREA